MKKQLYFVYPFLLLLLCACASGEPGGTASAMPKGRTEASAPESFDRAAFEQTLQSAWPAENLAVRSTAEAGAYVYVLSGSANEDEALATRIDRYKISDGTHTGLFIPRSTLWEVSENAAILYAGDTWPDFYVPGRFPAFLHVQFSPENGFCYAEFEQKPLALASDGFFINNKDFKPDGIFPESHQNTVILDISQSHDGARLLLSRPAGFMTAGDTMTSTYAWMQAVYEAESHTVKLLLPRTDSAVSPGRLLISNVFIGSAELVREGDGFAVLLRLTEHAKSYTLAADYVFSPEHLPDGQSHCTVFSVTFYENEGVSLP